MHYDTSQTKSIGYILTSQKQAIHEFQKAFSAQSDKNTYAFYSLASEQREKYDDNEVFYYDIPEYATDNYFSVDYDALNQWLDGGDLVDNSLSDIIEITVNNETYYALVYFERYNGATWYVYAREACITSLTEEWYESELSSGDLFRDNDVMYGIDVGVFKEGVTE